MSASLDFNLWLWYEYHNLNKTYDSPYSETCLFNMGLNI